MTRWVDLVERVTLRGEGDGSNESEKMIYPGEGEGFSLLNPGGFFGIHNGELNPLAWKSRVRQAMEEQTLET